MTRVWTLLLLYTPFTEGMEEPPPPVPLVDLFWHFGPQLHQSSIIVTYL